ncbi:hypothetical protein [Hydrogenophilus thermoluteolus]|uniref:hypothetical protein n=1 Tax=Hydrogenophilus thermoluteolus TaxID=297 RepID=UPI002555FED9|nr:hypothetical protein [Hydrogenophilus thermoluteolus]
MHGGDKRGDLDFATKRKYNVTVSDAFEIGVKESLMMRKTQPILPATVGLWLRVPIRGRSIAKQRGVSFWFSPRCGFC